MKYLLPDWAKHMHILYLRILYIYLCISPLQEQFHFLGDLLFANFSSKEKNLNENVLNRKKSNPSNA